MSFYVYVLVLADGKLYTGSTSDLSTRLKDHRRGSGGATTGTPGKKELIHSENFLDRRSALIREHQIKRWSHAKKLALARGDVVALKRLARRQRSRR